MAATAEQLDASPINLAKPVGSKDTLIQLLESRKASIAAILPRHMDADRLLKLALLAFSRTSKLMQCTQISILSAITRAAELGIDFTGTLGGGYLVPYGSECQFIIGYRGLMDLARRHGDVKVIEARVVRTGDKFDYDYGLESKLTHKPEPSSSGKPTHVYAIARYKSGFSQFEVMTIAEVNEIRKRSKAANNGPWTTDYNAMAVKTVVRKLCKMLPLSPEFAQAVRESDEVEFGLAANTIDVEPLGGGNERLAKTLGVGNGQEPAEEASSDPAGDAIVAKRQDIIDRYRAMSQAVRDIFHGAVGFTGVEPRVLEMTDIGDLDKLLAHAVNVGRKPR